MATFPSESFLSEKLLKAWYDLVDKPESRGHPGVRDHSSVTENNTVQYC